MIDRMERSRDLMIDGMERIPTRQGEFGRAWLDGG